MLIQTQQVIDNGYKYRYQGYLQKCTKICFESKIIVKKMIQQREHLVIQIFQQYQLDKNINSLQLGLRKIISNFKEQVKRKQKGCVLKDKSSNTQRIYSQGSQLTTRRTSVMNSLQKDVKARKVINFDVSQLIKRLREQKLKGLAGQTNRQGKQTKSIKNMSHNSSISKFKLKHTTQKEEPVQNIPTFTSFFPTEPNQSHNNQVFQDASERNHEENMKQTKYLSNRRTTLNKKQIKLKIIIDDDDDKQNNINAQNWIIVDYNKKQKEYKNRDLEIDFDNFYNHLSSSREIIKKQSEKRMKTKKSYFQAQDDHFFETDRLTQVRKVGKRKGNIKMITFESETSRVDDEIKEGNFYKKIKEIIDDKNY